MSNVMHYLKHEESKREEGYGQWKSLVPVLYDWITNHKLLWPSLSCRWGPQTEQGTYKTGQRLYLAEQTDGSVPNTLIIADSQILKNRVAEADHLSQFDQGQHSPFITRLKTLVHPGEVNRIRELPQNSNIVATHTDCPQVLIWDVQNQPNRHAAHGAPASRPDLVLAGHEDNAEYALAMCRTEPYVLSGGKDKCVVLWSVHDHVATLAAEAGSDVKEGSKVAGNSEKAIHSPSIEPRGIYKGHTDTVEDVQFCPSSAQEFCSVGDDSCLIFWDARVGTTPVVKVDKAHDADLHCVDWNSCDVNFILTGSADRSVQMFDRRNLKSGGVRSPVHKFQGHEDAVLCVQWCPDKSSVFGSAAEDGKLNIWDHNEVGKTSNSASPDAPTSGLFFQHAGHRDRIVDFHWNPSVPWTIVSVSDDSACSGGGGTLQIWRMMDLIYQPEEEALAELDKHKDHILG